MVRELHLSKSIVYGMNVADWEMSEANFHQPISDITVDKTLSACAGSSPLLESAWGQVLAVPPLLYVPLAVPCSSPLQPQAESEATTCPT